MDIWDVTFSNRAAKDRKKLSKNIQILVDFLAKEIATEGPYRTNWAGYDPLYKNKKKNIPENAFHCHVKRGNPTYVVCWHLTDKKNKKVEIFYVGTHESSPYQD